MKTKEFMQRRYNEFIREKKEKWARLIEQGNFGHAHMIATELESKWGEDYDNHYDIKEPDYSRG